jgi:hypothetical protein
MLTYGAIRWLLAAIVYVGLASAQSDGASVEDTPEWKSAVAYSNTSVGLILALADEDSVANYKPQLADMMRSFATGGVPSKLFGFRSPTRTEIYLMLDGHLFGYPPDGLRGFDMTELDAVLEESAKLFRMPKPDRNRYALTQLQKVLERRLTQIDAEIATLRDRIEENERYIGRGTGE